MIAKNWIKDAHLLGTKDKHYYSERFRELACSKSEVIQTEQEIDNEPQQFLESPQQAPKIGIQEDLYELNDEDEKYMRNDLSNTLHAPQCTHGYFTSSYYDICDRPLEEYSYDL